MKKIGFIPFIIANYPCVNKFKNILNLLTINKKINYIEIGIPFKDSYSDGKIISKIYRKLKTISLNKIIKQIKKLKIKKKLIMVCYSNTIEAFGIKKITKKIKNVFKYVLIIDQPIKYLIKKRKYFIRNKIGIVYCIPRNEKIKKIRDIVKKTKGIDIILYLINRKGVTGKGKEIKLNNILFNFKRIKKKFKNIKIILGFGVNRSNLIFFKKKIKNFVVGTELIKLMNNKKYFKLFLKECLI